MKNANIFTVINDYLSEYSEITEINWASEYVPNDTAPSSSAVCRYNPKNTASYSPCSGKMNQYIRMDAWNTARSWTP